MILKRKRNPSWFPRGLYLHSLYSKLRRNRALSLTPDTEASLHNGCASNPLAPPRTRTRKSPQIPAPAPAYARVRARTCTCFRTLVSLYVCAAALLYFASILPSSACKLPDPRSSFVICHGFPQNIRSSMPLMPRRKAQVHQGGPAMFALLEEREVVPLRPPLRPPGTLGTALGTISRAEPQSAVGPG